MRVSAGTREGRGHRINDTPCQDAYAVYEDPERERVAAAVADGLGSRPLSHIGSQAATRAAVDALGREILWDEEAFVRAFEAARAAIDTAAAARGVEALDLATTLEVSALVDGTALGGMVGDGAIVSCNDEVRVLVPPEESEYANEVTPISFSEWRSHFRFASQPDVSCVLIFTDGLTRLLLKRKAGQWEPYGPFFEAFLPRVRGADFKADVVPRFLDSDRVDDAWDDDKCLVVMGRDDDGV
jgi:hypothetical protein